MLCAASPPPMLSPLFHSIPANINIGHINVNGGRMNRRGGEGGGGKYHGHKAACCSTRALAQSMFGPTAKPQPGLTARRPRREGHCLDPLLAWLRGWVGARFSGTTEQNILARVKPLPFLSVRQTATFLAWIIGLSARCWRRLAWLAFTSWRWKHS